MGWLRLPAALLRLAWPHLLTPWRSPLLRWRMETYGICDAQGRPLHAEELSVARMGRFLCRNRAALLRFLRWAASL
jgi:hypothetical protein